MNGRLDLQLPPSDDGLRLLSEELDRFRESHPIPDKAFAAAQVALDEVITNAVKYGYEGAHERPIDVRISLEAEYLEIEIVEHGRPFNPLEAPDPDVTASLEDRPIGGLGIYLVKKLMDEVEYSRLEGSNRLRLKKRLTP